jgi:hypothetical protein|tara:strand:- start:733 stop:1056 length:324 start_codon:yes stop_codon:yes gene_type:complete
MIQRHAMFHGTVKSGQAIAMRGYVESTLLPLWQQFDCAQEVQVYFQVEGDLNGPNFPLTLVIKYKDADGMARGLASEARYASRDLLPAFCNQFFDEVRLLHYVMDVV